MIKLMDIVEKEGIVYQEADLMEDYLKGLYLDNKIIISNKIFSIAEKRCVLAEELGHHFTSYGNIIDLGILTNQKQENIALKWAYEHLLPVHKLLDAHRHGCRSLFETAEFLIVTEEFFLGAINHYRTKHNNSVCLGRYIIKFDPLSVCEALEENLLLFTPSKTNLRGRG